MHTFPYSLKGTVVCWITGAQIWQIFSVGFVMLTILVQLTDESNPEFPEGKHFWHYYWFLTIVFPIRDGTGFGGSINWFACRFLFDFWMRARVASLEVWETRFLFGVENVTQFECIEKRSENQKSAFGYAARKAYLRHSWAVLGMLCFGSSTICFRKCYLEQFWKNVSYFKRFHFASTIGVSVPVMSFN